MTPAPTVNLDPSAMLADVDGALAALAATVTHREWRDAAPNGRIIEHRALDGSVSQPKTSVHAHFVRQGLIELAKKVFVDEVEIGVSDFDDAIYVVTDTHDATRALLAEERVRQAVMRLVGATGAVEVEGGKIHVEQTDPSSSLDEARIETIALLAHI